MRWCHSPLYICSSPYAPFKVGISGNLSPTPHFVSQLTDKQQYCLFGNIIYCRLNEAPPLLRTATPSLLSLLFHQLRTVAAERMSSANLMRFCVEHYEWFIEHEGIYITLDKPSSLEPTVRNLQSWRRRGTASLQKMHILYGNENTVEISALLRDIKHIVVNAEMYQHRLGSMIPIVTSLVSDCIGLG